MKYIGKTIDLKKYTLYDEIRKGLYEYRARNPELLNDRKNHNRLYFKIYNGTDIDTIMDSIFGYMNRNGRPYQEFLDFKQDFINMAIYDLKYMNPDRRLNNWFIRKNKKTGQLDLYPMFDNEMILGFDNDLNDGKLSEETLEKEDLKRKSAILLPKDFVEQKSTSDYREFMEYLLKKYPVQTTKALEQVSNVTAEDLEEILNSIEDVREERTKSAVQLFNKREEELNKIYEKHKERIR